MAKKKLEKGILITFEGPEGCGKSTHAKKIYEYLKDQGYDIVFTREPGGTSIGEKVRGILLDPAHKKMSPRTETLFFGAARAQIIDEVIKPALDRKKIVICDRFSDSTFVYQGYAGEIPLGDISFLNKIATLGINPDLTVLLDLEAEKGLKRATSSGKKDRMESKPINFHRNVRNGYLELARKNPGRIKVIEVKEEIAGTNKLVLDEVIKFLDKVYT